MITDERLAELVEYAAGPFPIDDEVAAALRELQELRVLLCELRPSLERWHDAGPRDEGWQSDELKQLLELTAV